MRILLVWDADYPWDVRVEKIGNTLLEAGHEVHLVCRNLRGEPREAEHGGLQLHRLPALSGPFAPLNAPFSVPAFFNPVWLAAIHHAVQRYGCEAILVRDLPLAPAALMIARRQGIPLLFDMAECYPEMLRSSLQTEPLRLKNWLLRNPWAAARLERWVIGGADHIFVMVEESRYRLRMMGVPDERIHVVSNTPQLERFPRMDTPAKKPGEPLTLIYQGLLNPARGLQTAIDAAAVYRRSNPEFRMQIVGHGRSESHLRDKVRRAGLDGVVEFLGWVDSRELPYLISKADIGLVPHYRNRHSDHTVPNKLFDYMAAGKPVIVSDARPLRRIVEQCSAGVVYANRSANELVQALHTLEDPVLRERMGHQGRLAVESEYNWNHDKQRLLAVIDRLGLPKETANAFG